MPKRADIEEAAPARVGLMTIRFLYFWSYGMVHLHGVDRSNILDNEKRDKL